MEWRTVPVRARARARRRRFRLYVVGLEGAGTTTVRYIFDHYRASHEVDRHRMRPLTSPARLAALSPARRRWEMRRRDLRFGLEVDSAAFLTPFVPDLAQLYPQARFAVLLRDCFTWMDTRIEKWLRTGATLTTSRDFRASYRWAEYGVRFAVEPSPEDGPLLDRDLPPVGTLTKRWAATVSDALASAPPERTLVLRTEDIDTSIDRLAAHCGVDVSTLRTGVRRNVAPYRERLLSQVSPDHVVREAERSCSSLMEQLWGPDWRDLVHRVPGWETSAA